MTTWTAPQEGGWVDIAANLPGDLAVLDVDGEMKVTKGIMQTLKSGEGFVMEFTGPGRVLTQTRNPQGLIGWLTEALPFTTES